MRCVRIAYLLPVLTMGLAAEPANTAAPAAPNATAAQGSAFMRTLKKPASWLTLSGEVRGRAELYSGSTSAVDPDSFYLHRLRLGALVEPHRSVRFFVQIMDSRVGGWQGVAPATVKNTLDIRQAWVELGAAEAPGWSLRAGRLPLSFGENRLIGTSNWGNVGPAFDGVNAVYRSGSATVSMFGTALVQPKDNQFDSPRWKEHRLHGVYASFSRQGGRTLLEPFAFWKELRQYTDELGRRGSLDTASTGLRAVHKFKSGWQAGGDIVLQAGEASGSPVRAWGSHADVQTPAVGSLKARLMTEYNYASGDGDSRDGKVGTFDQLYPTLKYAAADTVGWRNVHEAGPVLQLQASKSWKLRAGAHSLWLASTQDALYNTSGKAVVTNRAASSSHIGESAELRATWQATRNISFMLVAGRLFPGRYLDESKPRVPKTTGLLMWMYSF